MASAACACALHDAQDASACSGQSIGITEVTSMGMQVAECTEIAQKVFREEPYAENKLIVQHITSFFGSSSQYQLEKVKGPKKFSMIKAKVWHGFLAHAVALLPDMRAPLQSTPPICKVCHAMTDQYWHSMAEVWHAGVACAQVVERLKHVRWVTVSSTRDVLAEKHKDALTSKGVVRDRAKADALYESE